MAKFVIKNENSKKYTMQCFKPKIRNYHPIHD